MIKIINIYSNKNVNLISIIISAIIFLLINLFINNFFKIISTKNQSLISENIEEKNDNKDITENWYIEINAINLRAPIKEGTDMEILNTVVGHFEETPLTTGNVGLAGHNRGYEKNYFEKVKDLKIGEEIKYKYNDFEKIYIIDKIEIIKNTNWRYLENTQENKITLITCVEDQPDYRRCVQATEK